MSFRSWFFLSVSLLLIQACTHEGGRVDTEMIDGVEHVHNPGRPLRGDASILFEEEMIIEAEDESGRIRFFRPAHLLVDRNDAVYVADYRDALIKVFDAEGTFLRTIGRKGQGPGEFQGITAMAFRPDGRLLVLERRSRRSSLFDREGEFLGSHPWRESHFSLYGVDEAGYLTDENLYEEEPRLLVKKFDWEGGLIETWGEFSPYRMHNERRGDGTLSVGIPYSPQSILAGDPVRNRLYHCFNDSYRIEVYDGPGRLVRVIDRPYRPVPFTREDAEAYYAGIDRRNNPAFSELARKVPLPEVKTVTDRMSVDDRGMLWVETHETREENGRTLTAYDGFDPEGRYLYRLWLDFRPGLFVRGKMYRIHRDEETGWASLRRYRVRWND